MTLAQKVDIKLKVQEYEYDDPLVMQISLIPYSEVLATQGQNGQPENMENSRTKMLMYQGLTGKQILLAISVEKRDI